MKCPRCGNEAKNKKKNKFCRECGFPLNATPHLYSKEKLKSLFLDVEKGVLLVNGIEVKKVAEFSFHLKNGKYGLCITQDRFFKATVPSCIEKEASLQVLEASDV